jgi:hypothetical protein
VPRRQPVRGQRLCELLGRVEQHLDDAVDIAIGGDQSRDVHAEPACERGTHLGAVENLALDLARFNDLLGEGAEGGVGAQGVAESFHAADEPALAVADGAEVGR